jgi:hypothetical protein
MGASTQMCFLAPMLAQKKLPRVCLISFTGGRGGRNRGWGGGDENDDVVIPPGTPVAMVDLREVTVSSWSSGGSGGEDRFTGNVSLSAERSTYTVFGCVCDLVFLFASSHLLLLVCATTRVSRGRCRLAC